MSVKQIWQYKLKYPCQMRPAVWGDTVFAYPIGKVIAIDLHTGKEKWTSDVRGMGFFNAHPITDESGNVHLMADHTTKDYKSQKRMYRLDGETGKSVFIDLQKQRGNNYTQYYIHNGMLNVRRSDRLADDANLLVDLEQYEVVGESILCNSVPPITLKGVEYAVHNTNTDNFFMRKDGDEWIEHWDMWPAGEYNKDNYDAVETWSHVDQSQVMLKVDDHNVVMRLARNELFSLDIPNRKVRWKYSYTREQSGTVLPLFDPFYERDNVYVLTSLQHVFRLDKDNGEVKACRELRKYYGSISDGEYMIATEKYVAVFINGRKERMIITLHPDTLEIVDEFTGAKPKMKLGYWAYPWGEGHKLITGWGGGAVRCYEIDTGV